LEIEKELTDYYGPHNSNYVQGVTMDYVRNNYPNKSMAKLKLAILKSHPHSWGFPDVSAIETAANRFEVSDKITLRNKKEIVEYSSTVIPPLTDEEKIELEKTGARKEWKNLVGKIVESKK